MNMDKVAFITGVTGQDGAHLAELLIRDGWKVYGGFRRGSSNKTWRLEALGIDKKVNLIECQLSELQNIVEIFQTIRPYHIYNLAGESFVADSFKYPGVALEVNTIGTLNILEAARLILPDSRLFFASSSEIFSRSKAITACHEDTPCVPLNPYGISKLAAQNFVNLYRQRYGLFACSGILFNHEGPLRGRQFVTRKITFNLARLAVKGGPPIDLGNVNSARDWGSAADYVKAMRAMLNQPAPRDMVIASGKLTSVRDFFRIAAIAAGFDPLFDGDGVTEECIDRNTGVKLCQVSDKYFRPFDTSPIYGDPSMIERETGWRRSIDLESMITDMVQQDINRWHQGVTNV